MRKIGGFTQLSAGRVDDRRQDHAGCPGAGDKLKPRKEWHVLVRNEQGVPSRQQGFPGLLPIFRGVHVIPDTREQKAIKVPRGSVVVYDEDSASATRRLRVR